jgi:hypothetical protein
VVAVARLAGEIRTPKSVGDTVHEWICGIRRVEDRRAGTCVVGR